MAGATEVKGRRIDTDKPGYCPCTDPGDFGRNTADGEWWAIVPEVGYAAATLNDHTITEHEDGSITAVPSILMEGRRGKPEWHGYLEHGVWRKV